MKKTAVVYARTNNHMEIDAQIEQLYGFAASQGFTVSDAYNEVVGGHVDLRSRTVWQMLQDAKDKRFDTILMRDVSRISRNLSDALYVINALEVLGVQLLVQYGSVEIWV